MRQLILRLTSCAATVLLWLSSGTLHGQDLTLTPVEWVDNQGADTPPKFGRLKTPDLPPQLRELDEPAYAYMRVLVFEDGKRGPVRTASTSPWLETVAAKPFSEREYDPAKRGAENASSEIQTYLIFNPASAAVDTPDATPRLLKVVLPAHPEPHAKPPAKRTVVMQVELDKNGAVASAHAVDDGAPPEYVSAATAAVQEWKFAPARLNGEAVPATLRVQVLFTAINPSPTGNVIRPPELVRRVPPNAPPALSINKLSARLLVEFTVSTEGAVKDAQVIESSNSFFDNAALEAVRQWRYRPALRNNQPIEYRMRAPFTFGRHPPPASKPPQYKIDGKKGDLSKLPPPLQWDFPPKPTNAQIAAYPFTLLQNKVEGVVNANFMVSPTGRVVKVSILSSPDPAFSRAVEAMLDTFKFTPAAKDGKPTHAMLSLSVKFDKDGTRQAPIPPETRSLLRLLAKAPEKFVTLSQLDEKPRAVSQEKPVFPLSLQREATEGSAIIEYIVDRKGVVHAPRIVSASREEFGYAAVQAVNTWKFSPPKKNRKPVNVLAQQPFTFKQEPITKPAK